MTEIFSDEIIDKKIPFRGPCEFCGHVDARHGLFVILTKMKETPEEIAAGYKLPIEVVEQIIKLKPYGKNK